MAAALVRHPSGVRLAVIALAVAGLPFAGGVRADEAGKEKTLKQVVITDQRDAQVERKESYLQKIVIGEEEVERFGDVSVGDILKRLTGISFTGPAGVTKDVRMRGLEKGYTQFMINGELVNSATKDRQFQVDRLPADMIERIEIIRAPSAEYDAGNIGGLINIVFKSKVDEVTRTRVALGKNGSLDVGDAIVQTSKRIGDVDVVLAASYTVGAEDVDEEKETYDALTGLVKSTEKKPKPATKSEFLFTPRITWHLGADRLTIDPYISKGKEDKEETKTGTGANVAIVTSREDKDEVENDQVVRLGGRYDGNRSWGSWYAKAAVQETRADKKVVADAYKYNGAGNFTSAERKREQEDITDTYTQFGLGVAVPLGAHLVRAGLEYKDADFKSRKPKSKQAINQFGVPTGPETNDDGQRDKFDIEEAKTIVYLQDEITLAQNHWLTPGIRYERVARDASGADKNGLAYSSDTTVNSSNPSLHYRWAIDKNLNFRASITQTVKLPKFDQLNPTLDTSKNGLTSVNAYTGGNVDLKPEEALGFELGFEKAFAGNRGLVGINFYERQIKDFVENRTNEEVINGNTRWVKRPYNVGEAHIYGMELDWRFPLVEKHGHVLNLVGNHTEMRGTIDSPSKGEIDVKEMPPRVTNLGLDYKHRPSGTFGGFSVNYIPKFTTESTNDNDEDEIKTWWSRTSLDMYVGKIFSPLAEVRLIGRNLLSVKKEETTLKGTNLEHKIESSRPTIMLTFESRF